MTRQSQRMTVLFEVPARWTVEQLQGWIQRPPFRGPASKVKVVEIHAVPLAQIPRRTEG